AKINFHYSPRPYFRDVQFERPFVPKRDKGDDIAGDYQRKVFKPYLPRHEARRGRTPTTVWRWPQKFSAPRPPLQWSSRRNSAASLVRPCSCPVQPAWLTPHRSPTFGRLAR